jgi:hypothetical protein
MKKLLPSLAASFCLAVLAGCATGKIEQVRTKLPPGSITKDNPIFVKEFDASKAYFKGEYSDVSGKVAAQRARIPTIISSAVISEFVKRGYNAKRYTPDIPERAIIIEGEITLVDTGSGAARFWVGMGAGNSTVRANVKIFRANDQTNPMADLQAAGTSGAAGGLSG